MNINEIFTSIQGEGMYAGRYMCFVRTWGCNLDCPWCDQPSALSNRPGNHFRAMSPEEVVQAILGHDESVPVCFTGGEPTLQHEALTECLELLRANLDSRTVTMETNGTMYLPQFTRDHSFFLSCSPKFQPNRLDGKLEAFGEKSIIEWIDNTQNLQLKFVVEDEQWFNDICCWLKRVVPHYARNRIPIIFQPEWFKGRENFTALVKRYSEPEQYDDLVAMGYSEIRFQSQMHKIIHVR